MTEEKTKSGRSSIKRRREGRPPSDQLSGFSLSSRPQHTELLFQRYQSTFIHTLEVGRQLFSMGDEETQNQLQTDLGALQEEWDNLHSLLGRRVDLTEAIIKVLEDSPVPSSGALSSVCCVSDLV